MAAALLIVFTSGVKQRSVKTSSFSDDEPAYDTVASDEDYSSLGDRASIKDLTPLEKTDEVHVCVPSQILAENYSKKALATYV